MKMGTPGQALVVLVEDDSVTATMYRLGLEIVGFEVSVAESGEALFDLLGGRVPDAVVLDYQLPGADGIQVLEAIRQNRLTSETVAFMLSNFPQSHDGAIDRVFELGAIAWLQKVSTSPATLAAKVKEALGSEAGGIARPAVTQPQTCSRARQEGQNQQVDASFRTPSVTESPRR